MTTTLPSTPEPHVTVLICTRDRGSLIHATLKSVLVNDYANFELVIVDQSSEAHTAQAVAAFRADPRLRYLSTRSRGLSQARNLGLAFTKTELVLMTDDDCEVPPDWVAEMVAPFLRHPQVGIVFCDVVAGPHDSQAGFIPISRSSRALLIEDLAHWQTCDGVNIGIGAGMAIRRATAEAIGGFDRLFGPGAAFRNGDDLDFTLRALIAQYQIMRINHVAVVHHGFRTMQQNRTLMREALFGAGAIYGRLIRSGQWRTSLYFVSMAHAMLVVPTIHFLRQRRLPPVLGRAIWLFRGLFAGLRLRLPARRLDSTFV